MPTETTLVLLKPDAVRRGLIAEIIGRFERRGFRFRGLDSSARPRGRRAALRRAPRAAVLRRARRLHHVRAARRAGARGRARSTVRAMMGATDPLDSAPGTIRGDFALVLSENVVHGSDSPESAERELPLFFGDGELLPAGMSDPSASAARPGVALAAAAGDPDAARAAFRVAEPRTTRRRCRSPRTSSSRRTAAARRARSSPARARRCSASTRSCSTTTGARQARGRRRGRRGCCARSPAASTSWSPASRCCDGRELTGHAATVVRFRPLDAPAIDAYVARGEWQGRAGGYAIQGRAPRS